MTLHYRAAVVTAAMLLAACGGGDDSGSSQQTPSSGTTPPPSSSPAADTTAPTVSTTASVSSDTATFVATANDNVGVTSVSFLVDNGAIQGDIQKSPSGGSYTLQIPSNILGVGDHTVSATAVDAAGNTSTSAVVAFSIGNQPNDGPDTTAPTVTAAVEGNFGLVKLTAIAKDDVRIDGVNLFVDGQRLSRRAIPAYLSTDPADQYYLNFDTTTLADGQHFLLARASDRAGNVTDSTEITFNVDSTAGLIETAPNDDIANSTLVMRTQLQIAGTLKTITQVIEGISPILKPDYDYYRISLGAGETVSLTMLSASDFFMSLVDASETQLSTSSKVLSDIRTLSYTNGPMPQDAYIRISSIPFDFTPNDQYKITLSYR